MNWEVGSGNALLPRVERALAWAVIGTVFFLPVSEALKNIGFVVSLALYVGVICAARQRIFVPPVGWLFLSFLGAAILSAVVSPYPGKTTMKGVFDVFRYTSFLFIVERGVREERHVRAVLWAAVTGLGLTALVTLFRYWDLQPISALSLGMNEAAALYAVMGLALMFGIYVHSDVAAWPLIYLIAVAGLTVMLLGITHARMLWGGFILVGVILGCLRSARVAITAVAISVLIVLGVALMNPVVREQVTSLGEIENYKTLGNRMQAWEKAMAMWRDAPWLGIGPKAFILHDDPPHNPQRSKYGSVEGHAHNLWLYKAVEMGSVGVLILAATFAYLGFWLIRWRRHFASSWPAAVWDGAFGSWLAILVAGLTEPSFGYENAMFFVMLVVLLRTGVSAGEGSHQVA